MGLIILSFFFSFSFFLKNEPGAVGTPGMGRQKCHFCEKDMKKKVNKKFSALMQR